MANVRPLRGTSVAGRWVAVLPSAALLAVACTSLPSATTDVQVPQETLEQTETVTTSALVSQMLIGSAFEGIEESQVLADARSFCGVLGGDWTGESATQALFEIAAAASFGRVADPDSLDFGRDISPYMAVVGGVAGDLCPTENEAFDEYVASVGFSPFDPVAEWARVIPRHAQSPFADLPFEIAIATAESWCEFMRAGGTPDSFLVRSSADIAELDESGTATSAQEIRLLGDISTLMSVGCPDEAQRLMDAALASGNRDPGFDPGPIALSPEEAACSGLIWAVDGFSDVLSEDTLNAFAFANPDECVSELGPVIVETAVGNATAPSNADLTGWFVVGCYPISYAAHVAIGEELSPSGEGVLDEETLATFATASCEGPFVIGVDMGDEWEILREGVCYYLDFVPTPEQVDSGLVPCP